MYRDHSDKSTVELGGKTFKLHYVFVDGVITDFEWREE